MRERKMSTFPVSRLPKFLCLILAISATFAATSAWACPGKPFKLVQDDGSSVLVGATVTMFYNSFKLSTVKDGEISARWDKSGKWCVGTGANGCVPFSTSMTIGEF